MKKLGTFILLSFILLSSAYVFTQERMLSEYRIGPKDVVELSVVGDETLSGIYMVAENGKITLPYLGDVKVEGMTKSELGSTLEELLDKQDILENPQVIVLIREIASKMISVLGAVQEPGRFPLSGRLTLRQVIAQAGGETSEAGDVIEIIRYSQDGSNDVLTIPRRELYSNADYDIALSPDDIVRVLEEEIVWIYVGGQVANPGRYEVGKSNIPTLVQAIIQAGDFADRAAEGSVILRRKNDRGGWDVTKHDVNEIIKGKAEDVQLLPNDVVVVPKSVF